MEKWKGNSCNKLFGLGPHNGIQAYKHFKIHIIMIIEAKHKNWCREKCAERAQNLPNMKLKVFFGTDATLCGTIRITHARYYLTCVYVESMNQRERDRRRTRSTQNKNKSPAKRSLFISYTRGRSLSLSTLYECCRCNALFKCHQAQYTRMECTT